MKGTDAKTVSSGAAHLLEAVHALEHNELDEAVKALKEAVDLLPPGDLFEAAEHGLGDIEADKAGEALDALMDGPGRRGHPPAGREGNSGGEDAIGPRLLWEKIVIDGCKS